jgi:hypothetical protein
LSIAVKIREAAALLELPAREYAGTSAGQLPFNERFTPGKQPGSVEGGTAKFIGGFPKVVPDELDFLRDSQEQTAGNKYCERREAKTHYGSF